MKFAKYLQEEIVPEWRKAYINYKQGKRHLKDIEHALDRLEHESPDFVHRRVPAHVLNPVEELDGVALLANGPLSPQELERPDFIYTHSASSSESSTAGGHYTTPIIKKGHGRNYSAIVIPPSPTIPSHDATSQTNGFSQPSNPLTFVNDTPSAAEGSMAMSHDTIEFVEPIHNRPAGRSATSQSSTSAIFQFGQTARSRSFRLLRSLSTRFSMAVPVEVPSRTRSIQVEDNSLDSIIEQLLPEEKVFFQFLDQQLDMVNRFYEEKELEAVTKLKVIKQQLYIANEWKRRYDDKMTQAQPEGGWYVSEWSRVKKGIDSLIKTETVPENVTIGTLRRDSAPKQPSSGDGSTSLSPADPEQGIRYRDNKRLVGLDSPTAGIMSGGFSIEGPVIVQEEEDHNARLSHKVARTRIKAALYEFYRSLEMIRNYKVLNHTGFVKILKKFDKTAQWKASRTFVVSKLRPAYFMSSSTIQNLIDETESIYIESFEKGHRRRGMAKLRIPDSKGRTHHLTATRVGLYLGLAAPLLFQAVQAAFSEDTAEEIPYWDSLMLVYAGLFLTFMFACLFGVNMYVWSKSRINYKFIFEFDPRDNLDFYEYFEIPVLFVLLLSLAVYLDFGSKLTQHVATAYWPLILMLITAFILFCPLPIAHATSRRWFIASIGRIIASGYYRVEFRDFFLADEMNSLSYSIEQFEFALCAYAHQWTDTVGQTCATSRIWLTPFLTALPAWFRFLQCLRRYNDTLEWFPHLINAGKYTASLATIFVFFAFRYYGDVRLKIAYILIATTTSIYTFTWDVYMDWGLFRFGKRGGGSFGYPFLRQELVYTRPWIYYFAIITDFLGRFSWIARLLPLNINGFILSFTLAFIEVLRRWQWNFFRLENEHLNNCGQFRAIKDIPLPFHIRVEDKSDDEEEYGEEYEEEYDDRDGDRDNKNRRSVRMEELNDEPGFGKNGSTHGNYPSNANMGGPIRSSGSYGSLGIYSNQGTHGLSQVSEEGRDSLETEATHGSEPMTEASSKVTAGTSTQFPEFTDHIGSTHATRASASSSSDRSKTFGFLDPNSRRIRNADNRPGHNRRQWSESNMFSKARSSTFVEAAVAEAGFKNTQREAIESESRKSNKFYDRRDFDSKLIETESKHAWKNLIGPSLLLGGALSMPATMHGLQSMSAGGMESGGGAGLYEQGPLGRRSASHGGGGGGGGGGGNNKPRARAPLRRQATIGEKVRGSIFGKARKDSDDDDDSDEDFNIHAYYDSE